MMLATPSAFAKSRRGQQVRYYQVVNTLQQRSARHRFLGTESRIFPGAILNLFDEGDAMPQNTETPIQISVINASTVLHDEEVQPVIAALQKQVTNDFLPPWGVNAELRFVPTGKQPDPGTWWLTLLDDSDQAGALGYHDLTSEGQPIGKVFAGTDLKFGSSWSVTASHELLEMLGDPNINLTVLVQGDDQTAGTLYAYEVCDACEDDKLGYEIDKVLVSDFVYPSWFESFREPNSTQFDKQKKISKPLQLLGGGYIGVFNISGGNGWTQVTAQGIPTNTLLRGNVGSRRERRRVPRQHWVKSSAHPEILKNLDVYRERVREVAARRKAA